MVSMQYGPVLCQVLDLMEGKRQSAQGDWDIWVSADNTHQFLRQPFTRDALDELSPAAIDILRAVWEQFGHMDKSQIVEWTHTHCSEWLAPQDSPARPLEYAALARAVGFDADTAKAVAEHILATQQVNQFFATP